MYHKKRFCILTTAHPTDDVRVYHKIAVSLVNIVELTWIGPNFSFFENVSKNEQIKWELFKKKGGVIGRIYSIFKTFLAVRRLKNFDFVYCPDPDSALTAVLFRKNKSIKVIFDIHEVYHKDLLSRWINPKYLDLSFLVQKLIVYINKRCALVVGVSNTVLSHYRTKSNNELVVRSCAPKNIIEIEDNRPILDKNPWFTIVHGKNHLSRGTATILQAIQLLKEHETGFKVLMIDQYEYIKGNKTTEFAKMVDGIEDFLELHNGLSFSEMQYTLSKSDAGMIAYGRDLGIDSLPNRIFEYMAAGLPVIVPIFAVEITAIVMSEKCGLCVDTESPQEIADAIKFLKDNALEAEKMGENGREAFYARHNWESEIAPLINWININ